MGSALVKSGSLGPPSGQIDRAPVVSRTVLVVEVTQGECAMADLVQNAVGERIYVWSRRQGKPSPEAQGRCVISSHGGQSIINSKFPVEDVKLVFYGPHGSKIAIHDTDILCETKERVEVVSAGDCQDYYLSKYQGSGSGGAVSYEDIQGLGDEFDRQAKGADRWLISAIGGGNGDEMWRAALNAGQYSDTWKDIVTIRNRRLKFPILLSQVITELRAAGYRYTEFHCRFCRTPVLPWKDRPDYQAKDV
jgi:hypothetical protein